MVVKADRFTSTSKKLEYFSDFSINLDFHPITGDIARMMNEDSIKASIKHLILTNLGERPYEPDVGSKVASALFDNIDEQTAHILKQAIRNCIENSEPRVDISINPDAIQVFPNAEMNGYVINIEFTLINTRTTTILEFLLERVR